MRVKKALKRLAILIAVPIGAFLLLVIAVAVFGESAAEGPVSTATVTTSAAADKPAPQAPLVLAASPVPKPATASITRERLVLRFVRDDDDVTPMKIQRVKHYVVDGYPPQAVLREAAIAKYRELRTELADKPQPNRFVSVFVYPTQRRARAGLGAWIAMVSGMARNGAPIPDPEVTIYAGEGGIPTPAEDEIFDDLAEALEARDSATAYQDSVVASGRHLTQNDMIRMAELQQRDERVATKAVAKKHRMLPKAIDAVYIKVSTARM